MSKTKIILISSLAIAAIAFVSFEFFQNKTGKTENLTEVSPSDILGISTFRLDQPEVFCTDQQNQVNLSWTASRRSVAYYVERKSTADSNWVVVSPMLNNISTYTDNALSGVIDSIQYRIRAVAGHWKTYSNTVELMVQICSSQDTTTLTPDTSTQTPAPTPPTPAPITQTTKPAYATPYNTPYATPYTTPYATPVTTPPVSTKKVWGASAGYSASEISSFENLVGKPMNIVSIFVGWDSGNPFPSEFKSYVGDKGKTLLIFWEQYGATLDGISNGSYDAYIKNFAASAKAYNGPVILAPFHEMNGNWDPWDGPVGGNSPAKVIAAWQHIHDLFAGVTNVKFGWAVNNESVPNTTSNSMTNYYPGDTYVDYIGIDGFNFGSPWQNFDQVFGTALKTVSSYHKPIYLLSMASAAGSQKASWISDALGTQMANHPEIAGWVWFNENKEQDWRINSDAQSLNAFKAVLP